MMSRIPYRYWIAVSVSSYFLLMSKTTMQPQGCHLKSLGYSWMLVAASSTATLRNPLCVGNCWYSKGNTVLKSPGWYRLNWISPLQPILTKNPQPRPRLTSNNSVKNPIMTAVSCLVESMTIFLTIL